MTLLHNTPEGSTERIVDPVDVQKALAADKGFTFETGFMPGSILNIIEKGSMRIVVDWRKPQKTGFWLEGSEDPVRIPMPGLVMIRIIENAEKLPEYRVYALKDRSRPSGDVKLCRAPLPNVFDNGSICWGNIKLQRPDEIKPNNLRADWQMLLGTKFNSHGVAGKSESHMGDIREKYFEMEQKKTRTYPTKDLIRSHLTLEGVLERLQHGRAF